MVCIAPVGCVQVSNFPLAQGDAQDLPRGGHGQIRDELYLARIFVRGQTLLDRLLNPACQLCARFHALSEHDKGFHNFTPQFVRLADYCGLSDRGMF